MSSLCLINSEFIKYDEAKLHISDLGLQRGYGIFDYFLEMDGRVPFFDDYLDRFYRSAGVMRLNVPLTREELKKAVFHLLGRNNFGRSGIKLLLTGGYSEDLYTPPSTPNFMILNKPIFHQPGEPGDGVKLLLLDYERWQPEVKTTYYLPSLVIYQDILEKGAIEALYHHNGMITETTRANIFLVRNNRLITPSSGVLRGITRKYVIKVSGEFMPVEERKVMLEELWDCEEAFITGTSKHILPVVRIDGEKIGNGKPGERTKEISEAFERFYRLQ